MKVLLQRVSEARVEAEGREIGHIGAGLVIFLCAEPADAPQDATRLAAKVARLRIFADDDGRMNRSLLDIAGAVLLVSQFTLAADWRKGNRPSFTNAAPPEQAEALYRCFHSALEAEGVGVRTGRFGAHMTVTLANDGPVTIWMDSRA